MKRFSKVWIIYHAVNNPLSQWVYSSKSLLLMIHDGIGIACDATFAKFSINNHSDLMLFETTERWHDRKLFIASAKERIQLGQNCVTLAEDGRLAFVGWLAPGSKRSHFGYVRQTVDYPPQTATEYSVYVHPEFRGRGIFSSGLKAVVRFAFENSEVSLLVGAVESVNRAALRGHLNAGFEQLARLSTKCVLGKRRYELCTHPACIGYRLEAQERGSWILMRQQST